MLFPLVLGPYYVIRAAYKALFGWWLDPLLQRRKNQSLWNDVQANLYSLYTGGVPIREKNPKILPFDYASVRLIFKNISFCFTRGRGELNVTLAPSIAPTDSHEFAVVIAALDSRHIKPVNNFAEIASILRPRLDALNQAFSENCYPDFEKKLF